MTFKEEIFKELEQYETDLHHSKYEGYFRPQEKQMLKRLAQIYYETYGKGSNIIGGCNRCAFKDIQRIANDYFNQKEEMAKEAQKKAVEQSIEEKPTTTPKKNKTASNGKKTTKK